LVFSCLRKHQFDNGQFDLFNAMTVVGMEAIWKVEVEDFPAFIVVDDKGNDFFKEWQVE